MISEEHQHVALLITDPWHPVTAPTVRCLRRGCSGCRVVAVSDRHPVAGDEPPPPGVERVVTVPPAQHQDFAEAVVATAAAHAMTAVLPWTDRDARALAPHHSRFRRAGAPLVCPPPELVELADDKWTTMTRLAKLGLAVPATRRVRTAGQLREAALELGYPARSLILKPRRLAGGVGVWRIAADADPMAGGTPPDLPLAAMAAALDAPIGRPALDLVLQHHVEGMDTSVDVLAHNGRLLGAVARSREATLGGLSVAGRVSRPAATVQDVIERLVAGLGWSGLANVQLITDRDGRPVVYEINARAAGSIALASYAGVDLLAAAIHLTRTGRPPEGLAPRFALALSDAGSEPAAGHGPQRTSFRRYWLDHSWPAPAAQASRTPGSSPEQTAPATTTQEPR